MDKYPLAEQKLVYRVLHAGLMGHPDLMDSEFLLALQRSLQKRALADGVDVSDHGAWDEWLGNAAVPCEVRVRNRRTIG